MPHGRQRRSTGSTVAPPAAPVRSTRPRLVALDVLAIGAALLCLVLGWLSRYALNPDGVSYLDLAHALQRGDWTHFVQGYWSPFYPAIVGAITGGAGWSTRLSVIVTHAVNTLAALATLALVWWWARRHAPPALGYFAIGAFLLASAGMPRIEAVTPDLVLMATLTWLAYELIVRDARRWLLVGLLLGAAFLVKTSSWPWLIVALPALWWMSPDGHSRAIKSGIACVAMVLLWVVPMSLKYGAPTLGSSGRLNYSWYIDGNSSRLPDTDLGSNAAYRSVAVPGAPPLTLAVFDDWRDWTYQPWGDPTAWQTQVTMESGRAPTAVELVSYWLRLSARVFGLWLLPTIVAILVPVYVLRRRPGMWRELRDTRRHEAGAAALGLIGVLQFTAVHAEPRLIAPFAMLWVLGVLAWCFAAEPATSPIRSNRLRVALPWLGVVAGAGLAIPKFIQAVTGDVRLNHAVAQLDALTARAAHTGLPLDHIAVVGEAAPILSAAYWLGTHVVAQVPPASAQRLRAMLPAQQRSILVHTFGGRVPLVWETEADGGMQMLVVPPPSDSS